MHRLLILILTLVLVGCKPSNPPKETLVATPDTLLSEYRMVLVMADIHLTEAAINHLRNHGRTDKDLTQQYYDLLFNRYHISRRCYEQNLEYYQSHEEQFEKMYAKVLERLTYLSEQGKEKKKKEKNKGDSSEE